MKTTFLQIINLNLYSTYVYMFQMLCYIAKRMIGSNKSLCMPQYFFIANDSLEQEELLLYTLNKLRLISFGKTL